MSETTLVSSAEDVAENILRFQSEFERIPELQERVTFAHDWYAIRDASGEWAFGHSKFVGYRDNSAARYLKMASGSMDGRNTESRLRTWFEVIDAETLLGRELDQALRDFLARRNRVPRKAIRISVLRSELDNRPAAAGANRRAEPTLFARIASDPRICGGRPCIKGTRMRVSDLVDMVAEGVSPTQIHEDFPYISEEDVAAALAYAARAVDHRIIRVA